MSPTSAEFLIFTALVYALWRLAPVGDGGRKWILLLASYVFYGSWDVRFLSVLLGITGAQWLIGQRIHDATTQVARRRWLQLSLLVGLGCLGYFKYAGFFLAGLAQPFAALGWEQPSLLLSIGIPIGISFYVFQSLTYTVDIYRQRLAPTPNLRNFALFIAFFPHITSGPIARARLLLPQFEQHNEVRPSVPAIAVFLIARGFIKKVAIADPLAAHFVNPAFHSPDLWASWFLWLAVFAYSFQIYMDLSGYTDIVRGIARLFGYELQENFQRPYLARTVSAFWQRWHISMSSFFREYLFWATGGSKHGNVFVNLMITFVAIGLWHGAGWNFVMYGFLHGALVCIERVQREKRRAQGLPELAAGHGAWLFGWLYTFLFVVLARILFVASDLGSAGHYVEAMFGSSAVASAAGPQGYVTLALAVLLHVLPVEWEAQTARRLFSLPPLLVGGGLAAMVFMLIALAAESRPFVYFQF